MKRIKIYGENIITRTDAASITVGRARAIKLSSGRKHGWANLTYHLSADKLCTEIYSSGNLYRSVITDLTRKEMLMGEHGKSWWDTKRTVAEALAQFCAAPARP